MKETKDDNWSDWLINDKLRWERFGLYGWKERISTWMGIVLGSLLFIAILVVAFLILKTGNKLYSYTLMPFSELPINHTLFCIILDAILSLIIIVSKKRWRRGNNRVTMFFLLMFFNPVLCYFLFGFISFAVLYPNSNYGNKEIITQSAIFTGKVFRVENARSIVCYNFYLPQIKREIVFTNGFSYDWKQNSPCTIYLHKGYFGLYVADSVVYKEDSFSSTTLVAE